MPEAVAEGDVVVRSPEALDVPVRLADEARGADQLGGAAAVLLLSVLAPFRAKDNALVDPQARLAYALLRPRRVHAGGDAAHRREQPCRLIGLNAVGRKHLIHDRPAARLQNARELGVHRAEIVDEAEYVPAPGKIDRPIRDRQPFHRPIDEAHPRRELGRRA